MIQIPDYPDLGLTDSDYLKLARDRTCHPPSLNPAVPSLLRAFRTGKMGLDKGRLETQLPGQVSMSFVF